MLTIVLMVCALLMLSPLPSPLLMRQLIKACFFNLLRSLCLRFGVMPMSGGASIAELEVRVKVDNHTLTSQKQCFFATLLLITLVFTFAVIVLRSLPLQSVCYLLVFLHLVSKAKALQWHSSSLKGFLSFSRLQLR